MKKGRDITKVYIIILLFTHICSHVDPDAGVPPWVGFNEEEQMKAQIMELSAVRLRTITCLISGRGLIPFFRIVEMYYENHLME